MSFIYFFANIKFILTILWYIDMSYSYNTICYKTIGVIRTPFKESKGMPIQSSFSKTEGIVILKPWYNSATKGLSEFSHIILIYHFHKAKPSELIVKPFLSTKDLGIFSVRAPNRPNPIGISIVKLKKIYVENGETKLIVEGIDVLDQTPLLDIKPYVSDFDCFTETKSGWYEDREIDKIEADNRFSVD